MKRCELYSGNTPENHRGPRASDRSRSVDDVSVVIDADLLNHPTYPACLGDMPYLAKRLVV